MKTKKEEKRRNKEKRKKKEKRNMKEKRKKNDTFPSARGNASSDAVSGVKNRHGGWSTMLGCGRGGQGVSS
jgi:hypothetical protein